MNNFLNTQTNIMGLQYGKNKCEKKHIGKRKRNQYLCANFEVDIWEDQIFIDKNGNSKMEDKYLGMEEMKLVSEKKYLGQIIQSNRRNDFKIKDRTDKAVGNVNKILTSLNERPYG